MLVPNVPALTKTSPRFVRVSGPSRNDGKPLQDNRLIGKWERADRARLHWSSHQRHSSPTRNGVYDRPDKSGAQHSTVPRRAHAGCGVQRSHQSDAVTADHGRSIRTAQRYHRSGAHVCGPQHRHHRVLGAQQRRPGAREPQRDGGSAWNHYRGPDGNVYEIIGPNREAE